MTDNRAKACITMIFAIIAATLIAVGSNVWIGAGFIMAAWALAGLMEMNK